MIRFYMGGNPSEPDKPVLSSGYRFLQSLYGKWWMMLLEGIALIAVAVGSVWMAWANQAGITGWWTASSSMGQVVLPLIIVQLLGAMLAVFGLVYLIFGMAGRRRGNYGGLLVFRGILQIVFGLMWFLMPGMSASFLTTIIGFWALFTGVPMVFSRRRLSGHRWLQVCAGIVLTIAGFCLLFMAMGTLTVLAVVLTIVLGGFGIYLIVSSLGMRKAVNKVESEEKGFTDYTVE
ncbi:MAG: HdeD family acid-resistance protein [Eubacteriaceae bacterium]|jgi:uncharacterized membrane protein HdeD (DUF308 family)